MLNDLNEESSPMESLHDTCPLDRPLEEDAFSVIRPFKPIKLVFSLFETIFFATSNF